MERYIDAEKAIEAIYDLPNCPNGYSDTYDKECIIGTIKEVPTADVVPVVRCADCKYLNEELAVGGWDGSCRYWNTHSVTYSWFCSQGERRDDV